MRQLMSLQSPSYPSRMAKRAAKKGDGPWGDAIQYWFREKNLRQSHVVEGTGMSPNKASRAANGLDVRMETLRQFAEFLASRWNPCSSHLSADWGHVEERQLLDKVQSDVKRMMTLTRPRAIPRQVDPWLLAVARRLGKLPPRLQKSAIKVIADYEKTLKHKKDSGGKPSASPGR